MKPSSVLSVLNALDDGVLNATEAIEVLALATGRKKAQRICGTPEALRSHAALYDAMGVPWTIPAVHIEEQYATGLEDSFGRVVPGEPQAEGKGLLFAGAHAGEACREEISADASSETLAELYGYPHCCATAYGRLSPTTLWLDAYLEGCHGIVRADWRTNRVARLFIPEVSIIPDYFPCSVSCQSTLELAKGLDTMLHELGLSSLSGILRTYLKTRYLRMSGAIYRLAPTTDGMHFRIEDTYVYARGATPFPHGSELAITEHSDHGTPRLSINGIPAPNDAVLLDHATEETCDAAR